jgi:L-threonylcarbamoyladenylate synthase
VVVAHLAERRVLAYPTETVYGFGTAVDHESVESLVRMKQRPPNKPFLLLIGTAADARASRTAFCRRTRHVWPRASGRVRSRSCCVAATIGCRAAAWSRRRGRGAVDAAPGTAAAPAAYGEPITSTSCQSSRGAARHDRTEIVEQWPDEIRGLLHVLDGGRLPPSPPSTVVDCTGRRARVIRPGVLSAQQLRDVVPDLVGDT